MRAISSLIVVVVLAGAILVAFELKMAGAIYPGVRLGGVDVSGLTRADALARLNAARDVAGTTPLTLVAAGRTWTVTPARFHYALNVPASVDAAYALGRVGSLLQRLREQTRLLIQGRSLALSGAYDPASLHAYFTGLAAQIDRPARSAVLALAASGPVVQTTAQDGVQLDVARATPLVAAALSGGQASTITLPTVVTHPTVSTAAALREAARLTPLLAQHLTIIAAPGHSLLLSRADLAHMYRPVTAQQGVHVVYADVVDRTAVTAYIFAHAPAFDRPGRDARVIFSGGHVRVVAGRDGRVVNRGAAVAALVAALERRTGGSVTLPFVNGPTVMTAEATAVAARLQRTLRTTVVWLPQRHWAIAPAIIAAALALQRVPTADGARLVPHLDAAAIARALPDSTALAAALARNAAVVKRGNRYVVIPAAAGTRPNYAALAAEMVVAPPGRAVYHLPIAAVAPARTTAAAEALAREHRVTG